MTSPAPTADAARQTPNAAPGRKRDPSDPPSWWERPAAWLWTISPLMVWFASVAAVVAYLLLPTVAGSSGPVPVDPAAAVVIGLVTSVTIWLLSAIPLSALMSADRAQPRFYMELCERFDQLSDRVPNDSSSAEVREARRQLAYAEGQLRGEAMKPSLRWALGHGYISVMRSIHRADECLMIEESDDAIVGDAVHDDLLLMMSSITNRDDLRRLLRTAINKASHGTGLGVLPAISGTPPAPGDHLDCKSARQVMRSVRHAISVFRDDARDGLIRLRGRLQWTTLALAALTFLLVGLAMLRAVPVTFAAAASAFYLVAAIVGGFNRLRLEAGRESAVDDFGLSNGRLFAFILISGLAGVGGVYLVAALPSLIPTNGTTQPAATLETVFNLTKNQIGLVFAAVFGLAPGLASKLLLQQADRLEGDLAGARPATAKDSAARD